MPYDTTFAPTVQVRTSVLTPAGAQARLQRDRRFRDMSDGEGRLLHQIIVYCEKTDGTLVLDATTWLTLTVNVSRKTVVRRLMSLQDAGLLLYTPGLGRGNHGLVELCIRNWGVSRATTVPSDTRDANAEEEQKETTVSPSPVALCTENRARKRSTQEEKKVRYPQPPASPRAADFVTRFHDHFEKPAELRTPYFMNREAGRMERLFRDYPKRVLQEAWDLLKAYYEHRAKKPVSVGMLAYYCENLDGIRMQRQRVERQRKYHAKRAADEKQAETTVKEATSRTTIPTDEQRLRDMLGLMPHEEIPVIPEDSRGVDESLREKLKNALQPLRKQMLSLSFEQWIEPLEPVALEDGVWTVTSREEFVLEYVAARYGVRVGETLGEDAVIVRSA